MCWPTAGFRIENLCSLSAKSLPILVWYSLNQGLFFLGSLRRMVIGMKRQRALYKRRIQQIWLKFKEETN